MTAVRWSINCDVDITFVIWGEKTLNTVEGSKFNPTKVTLTERSSEQDDDNTESKAGEVERTLSMLFANK